MISTVIRYVLGVIVYEIGLFWACISLFGTFIRTIRGGRNGIRKFFNTKKHDKRPEFASDQYEHDYVRTRSGLRFHYVHAGDPDNTLMLCLHGFPECWYSWKHVIKSFSENYYVVAIDMRGYGDSDKPESISDYHIDYLATDVKQIIKALGYEKAVLVAHDWGGLVAWHVAAYYPEVVHKFIAMNSFSYSLYYQFVLHHPTQFLKSWYGFFYQLPYLPELMLRMDDYKLLAGFFRGKGGMAIKNKKNSLSDEEIEIYKNAVFQNLRYPINYYRACNPIYQGMSLKKPKKLTAVPTVLIWGSADLALDVRLVDFTKKQMPHVKSVIIEGASHWVQLDEPEKVNEEMKKFLTK